MGLFDSIFKKEHKQGGTSSGYDEIAEHVLKSNIKLYEEKAFNTAEELIAQFSGGKDINQAAKSLPDSKMVVCDLYVQNAEKGVKIPGGFHYFGIDIIDHHFPYDDSASEDEKYQFTSSTAKAVERLEAEGPYPAEISLVINHIDCDAFLASLLLKGIISPEPRFVEAAMAGELTGEENPIADLLMALQSERDIRFSALNFQNLLLEEPLEARASELVRKRAADREKAKQLVAGMEFDFTPHGVAYITLDEKLDSALVAQYMKQARVIVMASKMGESPSSKKEWEIKVRLGLNQEENIDLSKIDKLEDFGGRWYAGSTKRRGGTSLNAQQYAEIIDEYIAANL